MGKKICYQVLSPCLMLFACATSCEAAVSYSLVEHGSNNATSTASWVSSPVGSVYTLTEHEMCRGSARKKAFSKTFYTATLTDLVCVEVRVCTDVTLKKRFLFFAPSCPSPFNPPPPLSPNRSQEGCTNTRLLAITMPGHFMPLSGREIVAVSRLLHLETWAHQARRPTCRFWIHFQ
jgi:hypothetical protein